MIETRGVKSCSNWDAILSHILPEHLASREEDLNYFNLINLSCRVIPCHKFLQHMPVTTKQNNQMGVNYTPFKEFYHVVKQHLYPIA